MSLELKSSTTGETLLFIMEMTEGQLGNRPLDTARHVS